MHPHWFLHPVLTLLTITSFYDFWKIQQVSNAGWVVNLFTLPIPFSAITKTSFQGWVLTPKAAVRQRKKHMCYSFRQWCGQWLTYPSLSSQTHLRVIALITDSCGQLIYQGPILAVLWSTQHLQGPSPSTNWCSFVAMWWSGLTQMKK